MVLRRSLENYVNLHEIPDVYFLGFVSDEEKKLLFQKPLSTPAQRFTAKVLG